jgi:hypothetical protein
MLRHADFCDAEKIEKLFSIYSPTLLNLPMRRKNMVNIHAQTEESLISVRRYRHRIPKDKQISFLTGSGRWKIVNARCGRHWPWFVHIKSLESCMEVKFPY